MSLNIGMSSAEVKISEKELKFAVKVMKIAKKLGVSSMKLGSIEFSFRHPDEDDTRVSRTTSKVSAKKIAQSEKETALTLLRNEITDDLSTMHVEDPMGFERGVIENLIGDGGDIIEEAKDALVI